MGSCLIWLEEKSSQGNRMPYMIETVYGHGCEYKMFLVKTESAIDRVISYHLTKS